MPPADANILHYRLGNFRYQMPRFDAAAFIICRAIRDAATPPD